MKINKETIFFPVRIIFCITIIAFWTLWFISQPETKHKTEKRKPGVEYKKHKTEISQKTGEQNEKKTTEEQNTKEQNTKKANKKQETVNKEKKVEKKITIELPKPVNLPVLKNQKPESTVEKPEKPKENPADNQKDNNKETPTALLNPNSLKLPKIASATRQALSANKPAASPNSDPNNTIPLRREALVEKEKIKPVSNNPSFKTQNEQAPEIHPVENWLPKYIAETKDIEAKKEKAISNLDQIVNNIELVELVTNGESQQTAAVIKNKLSNKTTMLKKGEEYLGLKLLEINNNEVVLGNESLNKTYIKRIVTTAP